MDNTARLWEAGTGAVHHVLQHKNFVEAVSFSHTGESLFTATSDGIHEWDVKTGKRRRRLTPTGCSAMAISPDGVTLAANEPEGSHIILWDLATGESRPLHEMFRGTQHTGSLAFSSDGSRLIAGYRAFERGNIVAWTLESRQAVVLCSDTKEVKALALSPDGKLVAWVAMWYQHPVVVSDARTGATRASLQVNEESASAVGFSPDGQFLASGGRDRLLHVWKVSDIV